MERQPRSRQELDVLRTVRDARFAHGLVCVRCSSQRVQRWGSFDGRQRYRCGDCLRTFSDLTASPLAYTKRLRCWPRFLQCWQRSESVRRTAGALAVHSTTAFRWRHRLCDAIRERERTQLHGCVEAVQLKFTYSEKGRGSGVRRDSLKRQRSQESRCRARVSVVILRDRLGNVVGGVAGGSRLQAADVIAICRGRTSNVVVLLSPHRRFEPLTSVARAFGVQHLRVHVSYAPDPLIHLENARTHARGLTVWLDRFRGVATRYLPNYLAWYRTVECFEPAHAAVRLLGRSVTPRYQQSARTGCEARSDQSSGLRPRTPQWGADSVKRPGSSVRGPSTVHEG